MLKAVANVTRSLLERHSSMPEGPLDGVFELLFGLALGVWRAHPGAPSDKRRCV